MKAIRFQVTGMSCAACAARVEQAVRRVEGVRGVQVSLLTRSMVAEAEAERVSDIIAAVTAAGYGAGLATGAAPDDTPADEARTVRRRWLLSAAFLLPLVVLCHMGQGAFAAIGCWLLLVPIVVLNRAFFRRGVKGLLNGAPNMDTLVSLGALAAIVSGAAEAFLLHGGASYIESAGMILTLITLGKWLEARATVQTGSALRQLRALLPDRARVRRGEDFVEVPSAEVAVGDILWVKPGERVAADGVVEEGASSIDESTFTGESLPVAKGAGSKVCAGTLNGNGALRVRVEKPRGECALAGLIHLVGEAAASKAPIARLADRVAGLFVPAVLLLAVLTAVLWLVCGASWETAVGCAIAVLVISCPCALGLATPVAIMVGAGKGAEQGVLFRSGAVLEATRHVRAVLLDKTGTLTEGRPAVTDIAAAQGDETALLALAAAVEAGSNHPLAAAVTAAARERGVAVLAAQNTRYLAGRGVQAEVGGVLCSAGNAAFLAELGVAADVTRAEALAAQGKTPLFFARGKTYVGLLAVADPVRPSSAAAIQALRATGLRVLMVTGDNARTAAAVAAQVGITEVVSGALPQDKVARVRALQAEGLGVAVVGDGVNDAPALTAADVGMAIGAGTDVALSSAGVILLRSDPGDVVSAFLLSRAVIRTIRQNLFWAFFYNALAIPLAAGAYAPFFGCYLTPSVAAAAMSLSSFCVVMNALRLKRLELSLPERNQPATTMKNQTIKVEGMMCPHCERHLTEALLALPQVESCTASHKAGNAVLTLSAPVSPTELEAAVTKAGYSFRGVC